MSRRAERVKWKCRRQNEAKIKKKKKKKGTRFFIYSSNEDVIDEGAGLRKESSFQI